MAAAHPSAPSAPARQLPAVWNWAHFELDLNRCELRKSGRHIDLPPREFALLILLVTSRGRLVTRAEIGAAVWADHQPARLDDGINSVVKRLRRALGDNSAAPVLFEAVSHQGYRFLVDVYEGPLTGAGTARQDPPPFVGPPPAVFDPALVALYTATAVLSVALGVAVSLDAYGVAIALFVAFDVLLMVAPTAADTPLRRTAVALLLLAGMSYSLSAWNLSDIDREVINMGTLGPALLYLFLPGLRYMPAYVAFAYDDYAIWASGLPQGPLIVGSYAVVCALNIAVVVVGFHHFNRARIDSYGSLFTNSAVAFVAICVFALVIEHDYQVVNRTHLDLRRAAAYVSRNPKALIEYRQQLAISAPDDAGPDFVDLVNSEEFERAVREDRFYRQNFDEPFQMFGRSVILAYKRPIDRDGRDRAPFVFVRLPDRLALALRFQRADP
jgi:DNA-binding winged helix-turn-helix (wHTH) protein